MLRCIKMQQRGYMLFGTLKTIRQSFDSYFSTWRQKECHASYNNSITISGKNKFHLLHSNNTSIWQAFQLYLIIICTIVLTGVREGYCKSVNGTKFARVVQFLNIFTLSRSFQRRSPVVFPAICVCRRGVMTYIIFLSPRPLGLASH